MQISCAVQSSQVLLSRVNKPRLASQVLKSERNTSSLVTHLKKQHGIHASSPVPGKEGPSSPQPVSKKARLDEDALRRDCQEEEVPPSEVEAGVGSKSPKIRRQVPMNAFLVSKHNLKNDMLRLICESNVTLHQVASSETLRRILKRAYPNDPPPPSSIATLRKLLQEKSTEVRNIVRTKVQQIRERGMTYIIHQNFFISPECADGFNIRLREKISRETFSFISWWEAVHFIRRSYSHWNRPLSNHKLPSLYVDLREVKNPFAWSSKSGSSSYRGKYV